MDTLIIAISPYTDSAILEYQILPYWSTRYCHTGVPDTAILEYQILPYWSTRYCHTGVPDTAILEYQILPYWSTRYCHTGVPDTVTHTHAHTHARTRTHTHTHTHTHRTSVRSVSLTICSGRWLCWAWDLCLVTSNGTRTILDVYDRK